jgi:hypothetical protein
MQRRSILFLCVTCNAVVALQYSAFDSASASSTYSKGSLDGSPAFGAQQATAASSGYWCRCVIVFLVPTLIYSLVLQCGQPRAGCERHVDWCLGFPPRSHRTEDQLVRPSRSPSDVSDGLRSCIHCVALDCRAYSPGEAKVLVSADGANFEEAVCWRQTTRADVAFEETVMFSAPYNVKAVTVVMRSPSSWQYFGISDVVLLAKPGPVMLVSGASSTSGEQCVVVGASGALASEPCLDAIAAGDGREIFVLDDDGRIGHLTAQLCVTLADGDA